MIRVFHEYVISSNIVLTGYYINPYPPNVENMVSS